MPYITWSPELATGIRSIDSDHRNLVDILNALHAAVQEGRGHRQIGSSLAALRHYVEEHFTREEHFMEQAGYPRFEEHVHAHRKLTETVQALCRKYETEPHAVPPEKVLALLKDWLLNHIQKTDMDYVPYLRGEKEGTHPPHQAPEMRQVTLHLPADKADLAYVLARLLTEGGEAAERIEALLKQYER